jgi:hypothetical protein
LGLGEETSWNLIIIGVQANGLGLFAGIAVLYSKSVDHKNCIFVVKLRFVKLRRRRKTMSSGAIFSVTTNGMYGA